MLDTQRSLSWLAVSLHVLPPDAALQRAETPGALWFRPSAHFPGALPLQTNKETDRQNLWDLLSCLLLSVLCPGHFVHFALTPIPSSPPKVVGGVGLLQPPSLDIIQLLPLPWGDKRSHFRKYNRVEIRRKTLLQGLCVSFLL
jgi:hypothetical protein